MIERLQLYTNFFFSFCYYTFRCIQRYRIRPHAESHTVLGEEVRLSEYEGRQEALADSVIVAGGSAPHAIAQTIVPDQLR